MSDHDLALLRDEYRRAGLRRAELDPDPLRQAAIWLNRAVTEGVPAPNAMALATADGHGAPSVRFVLLKGLDARGFTWFTNLTSRKAGEIGANPRAALTLYWSPLERQVRAAGAVEPVDDAEADAYFASRPRGSQLAAWASPQSRAVPDRADLERRVAETAERFGEEPIPRPPFWGGYRLVPEEVELWQGRPSRLHDRFVYRRVDQGWTLERLAP